MFKKTNDFLSFIYFLKLFKQTVFNGDFSH